MRYKDWLCTWIEDFVKPVTKQCTYIKYKKDILKYLIPDLGEYEMQDLSSIILQKFMVKLSSKNLSVNTISGVVSVLKQSIKKATMIGIADNNYVDAIMRPRIKEKQIECFSKQEQQQIEKYILIQNRPKMFGIILSLYTGIRIGELLALKWEDIDFEKRAIRILKTCHDSWIDGKYVKILDSPKTESSCRVIPLPKQLIPKLRELKRQSKYNFVIGGKTEMGIGIRSYQRTFETLLKNLEIPHRGFHALRHTFATRAIECGFDVKTLSEILGHKNPNVTLKRYVHSLLEHKIELMNKIGRIYDQQLCNK